MTTIEAIYRKAKYLDALRLQELSDFLDFLLQKKKAKKIADKLFPRTELESPNRISPYIGKPLSLDDMDNAIQFEAGLQS